MANWKAIQHEWETSTLTLAELATKHDVKLGSLKSKKSRDAKDGNPWMRGEKDATQTKVATKKPKEVATVKDARLDIEMVVEAFAEETETNAELSDVQRQFCLEYVLCMNATRAYQKAYETTYDTANANGPRLLVKASIRAEITRLKKIRAAGIMLNGDDVLQKWIDLAFSNIGDYLEYGTEDIEMLDFDGNLMLDADGYPKTYKRSYVRLKDGADLDNSIVSEVKQGKDGVSVKIDGKIKALEFLSKYTNLLDDRTKTNLEVEKAKVQLFNAELEKMRKDNEQALKLAQMQVTLDKTKAEVELKNKELEQLGKDEQNKDFTINFVRKG